LDAFRTKIKCKLYKRKSGRQAWPFSIRRRASIEYFHANPVTRKLCDSVEDYKWGSARAYYELPSVLSVDIWQPFGP
jgi:hypothetical protein